MKKLFFLITATLVFMSQTTTASHKKGIIFDCDGILVDSEGTKCQAWQQTLRPYGVNLLEEDYNELIGLTGKAITQAISSKYHVPLPENLNNSVNLLIDQLQATHNKPITPTIELVKHLAENKHRYNISLAVASSARKKELLANLKLIGLENSFDAVVSGKEDLAHVHDPEGVNKPKPYIYLHAAKLLGIPSWHCIVFEDSKAGVDAALQAGMRVFAIPSGKTIQQFDHSYKTHVRFLSSAGEFDINQVVQPEQHINKKVLILAAGLAGVGKSTLLKELHKQIANSVYIDKDVINEAMIGDNPRAGDYYNQHVRFQSYEVMFNIAKDNLKKNNVVILDGMFGDKLTSDILAPILNSTEFEVKIVYCSCDVNEHHKRMLQRNNPRDNDKKDCFHEYHAKEVKKHGEHLHLFPKQVICIDTKNNLQENVQTILQHLL